MPHRPTPADRERYVVRLRELADLVEAETIPTPLGFGDASIFLPGEARSEDVETARATVAALGGKWHREVDGKYVRLRGRTPTTGAPVVLWLAATSPPEGINLLSADLIPAEYRAGDWNAAATVDGRPVNFTGEQPSAVTPLPAADTEDTEPAPNDSCGRCGQPYADHETKEAHTGSCRLRGGFRPMGSPAESLPGTVLP